MAYPRHEFGSWIGTQDVTEASFSTILQIDLALFARLEKVEWIQKALLFLVDTKCPSAV